MHRDIILWSGISTVSRFGVEAINPTTTRPIGAYQMAWWLRKHGFSVQVIEFTQLLSEQELYNMTAPFVTDKTICIGASRTFIDYNGQLPLNMVRTLWKLKLKFKQLKVVMGGQYPGDAEKKYPVDRVFVGFSEDAFLTWCQQQKRGVSFPNEKFDIKNQQHRFIEDDIILPGEMLPIELGRGCIFKCKFCSYSLIGKEKGSYLRHHQHVIDEMKHNKDMFGVDKYMFLDDTVNEDYDKVRRFADFEKDLGFPIKWVGYCRADLIWAKPESAEHLRDSGLVSPHFGIESFHPKASQFIHKGWSGKHAKDWLPKLYHDIWDKKMNLRVNIITGLPYEPVSDVTKYVEWWVKDPLGHIFFSALALTAPPPPLPRGAKGGPDTRSELAKEAESLGFKFKGRNKEGMYDWESPWCTSYEARNHALVGVRATLHHNRVSSWHLGSAVNMGYTLEDAMKTWQPEVPDAKGHLWRGVKNRYITQFAKHFNLPELLPSADK